MSGYPNFIGVRVNAANGQYLSCFIPGFKIPTSAGVNRLYANFYGENLNHFKFNPLPNKFKSAF